MSPGFEDLPRPGIWKKLILGCFLVVFATAGATSVAAFHEVDNVVDTLKTGKDIRLGTGDIAEVDPGEPQTILLLGSDRRPDNAKDGGAGTGARSDTIILARLDPDRKATALMSLPRDLRVQIPGRGTAKINEAYELGGPALTLRTVKNLTGLPINHVINVDFKGFESAINAIGCIYVDVDRRYFNDSAEYAYINVPSGYQRLCGQQALEYARFRHEDTDLVRGVRQQEVIRATKQQAGVKGLVEKRDELQRIFGKYTTSDASLKNSKAILGLLKLAVFSAKQPIREVHFEGEVGITSGNEATGTPSFVTATDRTVKKLVQQFLGVENSKGVKGKLQPEKTSGKPAKRPRRPSGDNGLEKAPGPGKDQAVQAIQQGAGGQLPVYYPTLRLKGSLFTGPPRYYKIRTPGNKFHKSYRMVIKRDKLGEYYGVQGTTWKDPPLLEGGFDKVKAGKHTYEVHYDGDRVKLVAWRTPKAVYWISNTLLQSLNKEQMLSIARTARLP
ncbi:MAG TPA: LCP family protein [Thermoleophilaceae bacterium]|nr:LCP family protein [Thermoleophilaceae bacterium]